MGEDATASDRTEDGGPTTDAGISEPVEAAVRPVTRVGRHHRCPNCGSRSVAGIMFGYPAPQVFESEGYRTGEFVLGGCCVWPEMPEFRCHGCGHEWRRDVASERSMNGD